METTKSRVFDHLRAVALREHQRRLARGALWENLTFSRSRWLAEVLANGETPWSQVLANALFRRAQSNLPGNQAGMSDSDLELTSLINRIERRVYSVAFKYDTLNINKPASKLILKNTPCTGNGISYGTVVITPEQMDAAVLRHQAEVAEYNEALVKALRACFQRDNISGEVPQQILLPLTPKGLWGDEEDWRYYADFPRLKAAQCRRALKKSLCPLYDAVEDSGDDLTFFKRHNDLDLKLWVDFGSIIAQFVYEYSITGADGEVLFLRTLESMLGLYPGGWDGIAIQDLDVFLENFKKIDETMRHLIEV